MKIREIRTWVLRHELPEAEVFGSSKGWHTVRQALVVEILTEDGLTGFGEAYGPPAVNRTLVDEVYAPRLVGKNALEHAVLWEDLYTTFRDYGRKGWPVAAISAIDIALWDLKGKALRQPRSEEHTSELQSQSNLVCRLLLEKKNIVTIPPSSMPR